MIAKARITEAVNNIHATAQALYDLANQMRHDPDYPLETIVAAARESGRLRTLGNKLDARGHV